jgi:hypothetical protein
MLPVQEYTLFERYKMDSSIAYECSGEQLQMLIGEFGEMEPIIDAINVQSGASVEQRARDIGCSPEDFWYESSCESDGDMIGGVVDLWDGPGHSQR